MVRMFVAVTNEGTLLSADSHKKIHKKIRKETRQKKIDWNTFALVLFKPDGNRKITAQIIN